MLDDYQNHLEDEKRQFIANQDKTTSFECEFQVGDKVIFTNEYGVSFNNIHVTGFVKPDEVMYGRFIYLDYSCYWFASMLSSLKRQEPTVLACEDAVKQAKMEHDKYLEENPSKRVLCDDTITPFSGAMKILGFTAVLKNGCSILRKCPDKECGKTSSTLYKKGENQYYACPHCKKIEHIS